MLYELLKFLKAMNKSLMFASPKAGEYLVSFYLIAWCDLLFRTGQRTGFLDLPSVTLNKYAAVVSE